MSDKKITDVYDDGNIPDVDTAQNSAGKEVKDSCRSGYNTEPLPESSRPRKDGPGGD